MANKSKIKILIVDDEEDSLEFMSYSLEREGFEVFTAKNGKQGIKKANLEMPDLIILDVMMPEMDGIEACRELRSMDKFKDTFIVFLTARGEDYSQIAGFDVGADDYITKPIKPRVFVSRIKAFFRRKEDAQSENIKIGDIFVDNERYLVTVGKRELSLPKKEFLLLNLLMSKPGKVFTRDEILGKVWGFETIVGDRTIDVHIRKLREKIGEEYFKTIKGVGYKFEFD